LRGSKLTRHSISESLRIEALPEKNASNMPPKKKVKVDIKQTKDEVNKKEQEESESEESEDESTDDEDRGRGKRNRRESKGFEPFDFTMASEIKAEKLRKAGVPKGRGVKLGSIALVKEAIEKTSGDDLVFAYTFVFGHRGGKMTRKEMKEKLLEFSGYYPPVRKGKTEAELDREEELQDVRCRNMMCCVSCLVPRKLFSVFDVHR
jgi:hypothetical protein